MLDIRTANTIIQSVALSCNVTVEELKGKSRKQAFVYARHISAYFLREKCKRASLNDIGLAIGDRDHSTIIHSIETAKRLICFDDVFKKIFERAEKNLPFIPNENDYKDSGISPYVFVGLKLKYQ